MADVIEDLSGQVSRNNEQGSASSPGGALAAADTWLMVSSVSSEVCRSNAAGEKTCTCQTIMALCLSLLCCNNIATTLLLPD